MTDIEVAEAAEEIIRGTCKELDIEVIDMAVNVDHVHLFIKYPPKYSVWIAKRIKGRSSKQTLVMRKWILVDEEEKKVHKIWYVTLYNKLFGGKHQK
ncbi:MAG: transposase [Methanophagales archaeon]|nr:transposase [Methanophagales archaeon]